MIHPDTELRFINPTIGFGVVATKLIPKGTITWVMDELDQVFTTERLKLLDNVYKDILYKYAYRDCQGDFVLCWDHSRFVNHSFHSNCVTTTYNFELAVRDIYPGEELTDDYGYLNCSEPFECLPEPNTTRRAVMPDDLLHFYKQWDKQIISAFSHFQKVKQPLYSFIDMQYRPKINAISNGKDPVDSVLNCYYSEDESKMLEKQLLLTQNHFALM